MDRTRRRTASAISRSPSGRAATYQSTARSAISLVLVEAEPVAGVVAEQRLDAVGPLGRLLQEGDALAVQVLVGALDVIGLDDPRAHHALGDQAEQGRGVLLTEHRRLGTSEQDVQVGLVLRADRETAEAVHGRVAAHLEAELLGVELLGAVLVLDEHVHVRELLDHGPDATWRRPAALLPDCAFAAVPAAVSTSGRNSPGSAGRRRPSDGTPWGTSPPVP